MITTILFDMDGTLLPMDTDAFTKGYFSLLCKKMAPYGFKPDELVSGVWAGTKAMVKNDGSVTNREAFLTAFADIFGEMAEGKEDVFNDFYANEFDAAVSFCAPDPDIAPVVRGIAGQGFRVAVATNPIFPRMAVLKRLRWAGFTPDEFACITAYEDSHFCKPNPAYYLEVAERLGVSPSECLMVGNDLVEDSAALKAGMSFFFLDTCPLHTENADPSAFPHGSFRDLAAHISAIRAHQAKE